MSDYLTIKILKHENSLKRIMDHGVVLFASRAGKIVTQLRYTVHRLYTTTLLVNRTTMMKSVVLVALVFGANAFAPAHQSQGRSTRLAAIADLEGLRGVDIESGKKIVRVSVSANDLAIRQGY